MAESRVKVIIVPIRTEQDRILFNMAMNTLVRMIFDIVMELREKAAGGNDGNLEIDPGRIGDPGAGDLAGKGSSA